METVIETAIDDKLVEYQNTVQTEREKFNTIVNWHLEAYTQGGVELPWSADSQYSYVTKSTYNAETSKYDIDVDETLARLTRIVKYARTKKLKVEKNYSTSFQIKVYLTDNIVICYTADRDAMCEATVVGTKVIPAQIIPERVEEIVEYDCKKISLLK